MLDLSIVLPTYNEKENIIILVPLLERILEENNLKGEIIIVDDSSPDGTYKEAENLNKKYWNIRPILRKRKEGIGAALREGYNQSKGNMILSMDADMSFDTVVMLDLIKKLEEGYDLVIGKKIDYKAQTSKISMQRMLSKFGNKFMGTISGIEIHDFTANFRAMKRNVWQAINAKEKTNVFLFEMILLAKHKKFKIGEVPVLFKDRVYGKSKLNLTKEAPKFLLKAISLSLKCKFGITR